MAKLKNIIKQLSDSDYERIYHLLTESNAEKSADLLKYMHQEKLSDNKIMTELNVNTNAYYTLRSRLNQKIEEYLIEQIESPRTDLLRKVANINEIVFTKKRTIAITTLKKLEKELLEYDLSNELMLVYKTLKKLHVSSEEYFDYSVQYNRHVAYTLDVDLLESQMAEYFKKYGIYSFTDSEDDKLELIILNKQIMNTCKKYDLEKTHRLYIYQSCVNVFHRLFVEAENEMVDDELEPIEDVFAKMENIFNQFEKDSIYFHLRVVLEYLRLEYYNHYKLYRKGESYFEEVNDSIGSLLSSYNMYTYPARFLFTKLERYTRMGNQVDLYEENNGIFLDFEPDMQNTPQYVTYICYRALGQYYTGRYDEAIKWINKLLNDISLKRFQYVHLEIKLFLAVQYCVVKDNELLGQLTNSIQRQIRLLGKETCIHVVLLLKLLKLAVQGGKGERETKMRVLTEKLRKTSMPEGFCLLKYIKLDDDFINRVL
jgi:hypothetical protein